MFPTSLPQLLCPLALVLSGLAMQAQAIDIYLSPQGHAQGDGSQAAPLPSLPAAMAHLQEVYKKQAFEQATLWLGPGSYQMDQCIRIDPSLFQGNDVKLSIKSSSPQKAVLTGGVRIPTQLFRPLAAGADSELLHPAAQGKLYCAELTDTAYQNSFSQNMDDGSPDYKARPNYSLLSYDDEILRVAAWPNRGYAHFQKILNEGPATRQLKFDEPREPYSIEKPSGASFILEEQTNWAAWQKEFERTHDVVLEGFPNNDWFFQDERVGKIEGSTIQLLRYTRYGVREYTWMIPRRVKFVNLLCELDEPGEWYYDHQSKKLYLYPIAPLTEATEIRVLQETQMFDVEGMKNFSIENIILRNGGNLGIMLKDCHHALVAGCVFRNFVDRGFNIQGGTHNGILSNDFSGLFSVGQISGGDQRSLTPCHHYMRNNLIHDCRLKGYCKKEDIELVNAYGLIGLHGIKISFSNNLLYKLNGAINYTGCDILIEKNEFYDMGTEMNDWNVIYTGARWCDWGNVLRYNFAHHLMGMPSSAPIEAFRNDDMGMGSSYIGNIFYKAGKASLNFSGSGNDCYNNITLKTDSVWRAHFGIVGEKATRERWNKMLHDYDSGLKQRGDKDDYIWKTENIIGKFGWKFSPYITQYPRFNQVMNEGSPWRNSFCTLKNNYHDGVTAKNTGYTCYKAKPELMLEGSDWNYPSKIDLDSAFVDPDSLNFNFSPSFTPMQGFEPIPFDEIGLYTDEYRQQCPDKDSYRKAVKAQYQGIPAAGRKYNKKTANQAYDVPPYLK